MISQKCPKCRSKRIRRGYRPTPLWSKILCRYNLLCDSCNWEFTGFAVPGTVSAKPTKNPKKKTSTRDNDFHENGSSQTFSKLQSGTAENKVSIDSLAGQKLEVQKKGQP